MKEGYNKIFWGIFIATFNIKLGPITILPGFVGWMIVLGGVNILSQEYNLDSFEAAKKYLKILVGLTLIGEVLTLFVGESLNNSLLFLYYPILVVTIELLMTYKILEGSIAYLRQNNLDNIALEYEINLRTYTIFYIIATIVFAIAITFNIEYLLIILAISIIILRISLMMMVSRLKKMDYEIVQN